MMSSRLYKDQVHFNCIKRLNFGGKKNKNKTAVTKPLRNNLTPEVYAFNI